MWGRWGLATRLLVSWFLSCRGRFVFKAKVTAAIGFGDVSDRYGIACCALHGSAVMILYRASGLPWPGCHPSL